MQYGAVHQRVVSRRDASTKKKDTMPSTPGQRRIGLLIDRYDQPGWVRELVSHCLATPTIRLSLLLTRPAAAPTGMTARSRSLAIGVLQRLESRLLSRRELDVFHREDVRDQFPGATILALDALMQDGPPRPASLPSAATPLDLIVATCPIDRRPDLLTLAADGVWTVGQQDVLGGITRHAGLHDVLMGRDHSSVQVTRVGAQPAADRTLCTRSFHTQFFWTKNKARLYSVATLALRDLLQSAPGAPTAPDLRQGSAPAAGAPGLATLARYVLGQARTMAGLLARKYRRTDTLWRVALTRHDTGGFLPQTLAPPAGHFYADPFVHNHEGLPYIFFEDYAFADRRGRIAVAVAREQGFEVLGCALDLPYHLSFPYLFEYEGVLYMVPETCGVRAIQLWRCVDFPLRWELDRTLMQDVSAVDTIMFEHGGKWWMLTNIDRTDNGDHNDELFAFHASSPLSTDWTPHALNPVVRDPSRARNGGLIRTESGGLERCAQYQGFGHYGKAMSLNPIVTLTPDSYLEQSGAVRFPDFVEGQHSSMHHCHRHGGFTVFDYGFRR